MSKKRKSISKRMRFEVFKRDNFTCQYCSAKPPKVPLELDHIVPVSKDGKNSMDNLITACFDCNRGKSDIELDNVPQPLTERMENRKLAQIQYLEYKKIIKKDEKIIKDDIDSVELIFSNWFDDYILTDKFRITVKKFIKDIGIEKTKSAMEKACVKIHYDRNHAIKYFCGICWNHIKGNTYE